MKMREFWRAVTAACTLGMGACIIVSFWSGENWWKWVLTGTVLLVIGAAASNAGDNVRST